jgi:MerR family transcriptional regulator, copper efflux regulator
MDGLTIHEASETTGWSPRMLRYLESVGLIEPPRTKAGYRIFGTTELQRLRTLRELIDRHGLGPSDVAFAKRMRSEPELAESVTRWLESPTDWLAWEQQRHERLLAA